MCSVRCDRREDDPTCGGLITHPSATSDEHCGASLRRFRAVAKPSVVVIPLLSLSTATRRGRTDGIDEVTSWMPVQTAGWIEARPSPSP